MGLLDSILNAGNSPRQSGLSAATKALLLILAAKAAKDHFAHREQQAPGAVPAAGPAGGLGGILGGLLGGGGGQGPATGGLGALLGGGALGGMLGGSGGTGALGALVSQFQKNGYGDAIASWIGHGSNQPLAPQHLAAALGPDPLRELEDKTGLPQQTLLEELSRDLPQAVDHLTPQGRLPTDDELVAAVNGGAQR